MKRLLLLCIAALFVQPALAEPKLRCSKVLAESNSKDRIPSFSATAILDVNLLVQFTPEDSRNFAERDHQVEVRFFTPQGFLYESRVVPLTSDPRKTSSTKRVPGYRRPVPQKLVKLSKSRKEIEVSVPLPVAATSIVSNAIYGSWRAEVFLDGSDERCAPAVPFVITQ